MNIKMIVWKHLVLFLMMLSVIPSVNAEVLKSFDRGDRKYKVVIEKGGEFPKKSSDYVRYGKSSFVVEVPTKTKGIKASSYIKNRSEIFILKQAPLTLDHWIQFSVFLPKKFKSPDNWFLFFQAWQIDAANPIVSFTLDRKSKMRINVSNNEYYKGTNLYRDEQSLGKDMWHDFVINFKGGVNQDGKIFVWRRSGSKDSCYVKLVGRTGISIGKSIYPDGRFIKPFKRNIIPRVGIYRGGSSIGHKLWFDTLRYGKNIILANLDAKCIE